MKILEILFDVDVVHEYDEHHTTSKIDDCLNVQDVLGEIIAQYNWNDVVYVRYTDKLEASDVHSAD